ncbi:MAG: Nif3-like dinuclear metal center hexameric protein [Paludibacteraceae bacterium]|nr:Nif3-like dinuclear metal center hexameric protein [Paludibacteraceae bacterium]
MILNEIINIIESVAPLTRQEEWDNSGLQVGNGNAQISRALLTTDVTLEVVKEAQSKHCQLVLSHHPLLYHALKSITGKTEQEKCVIEAIRNDIAIYSSHTAMDNYLYGVSGRMARETGLQSFDILVPQPSQPDYDIRTGQFFTTGTHKTQYGLGVIGTLNEPVSFDELLSRVKHAFGADILRYIPPKSTHVQTIALCGGAGSEFLDAAIEQHADVFISADFKYHSFQPAVGRIGVIDMDHWTSEHFTRNVFAELLDGKVETIISDTDHSPVNYYK